MIQLLVVIDARIKQVLVAVACLLLVLYILQAFGVLGPLPRLR